MTIVQHEQSTIQNQARESVRNLNAQTPSLHYDEDPLAERTATVKWDCLNDSIRVENSGRMVEVSQNPEKRNPLESLLGNL
jgi:hypothetical protein